MTDAHEEGRDRADEEFRIVRSIVTVVSIGVVLLFTVVGSACTAQVYLQAQACFQILSSQTIPDTVKAQVVQSGACLALRPH